MTTPNPDPKPLPVLAIVAAMLLLVGAFTAVFVFGRLKQDGAHPASSPGAMSPTAAADSPGKESQFIRRLEVQNLQLDRSDAAAVGDAHHVCERFLGGESKGQIISEMLQGSPGMSPDTATDFADTAIDVYCPDGHRDDPT
ncbi:DUF732 domain-containing protein [Candidatus Mycobacterium wuenschmannii]|uniref:DUF732 domain-containing protein n=1 Tax=Candidatus Mycobacterium wuenschmannii TaxID=3027808 RepID=A0ABY8VW20_9MYCO|nr:DUF732 domain-containing protein [Candidatus Mycobacterium wuenschmannii]WIM87141.1 DUF732 domain-containing protein [Candidatus Mycobacterium wuenschmannii]